MDLPAVPSDIFEMDFFTPFSGGAIPKYIGTWRFITASLCLLRCGADSDRLTSGRQYAAPQIALGRHTLFPAGH
jgi:hypothetical protein